MRCFALRHIKIEQIDGQIWTVPGQNRKGQVDKVSDFRVALSDQARDIIKLALPFESDGYLFPGITKGVISDATMSRMMQRRGMIARPHGFRSSLSTWLADCTDAPEAVAELCIEHITANKVVKAYRLTVFLSKELF